MLNNPNPQPAEIRLRPAPLDGPGLIDQGKVNLEAARPALSNVPEMVRRAKPVSTDNLPTVICGGRGGVYKPKSQDNFLPTIPPELKNLSNWVLWRLEEREGKPTKIPYNPGKPGQKARANDPITWGTFEQATAVYKKGGFTGVGFEFSPTDPYCGVDLDHCRNPETGEIEPWAKAIIDRLASYTEISPSGCGVHILVKGKPPQEGRRTEVEKELNAKDGLKRGIEIYFSHHYFTMTGLHLEGTPASIEDRQAELTPLHKETFGKPQAPGPAPLGQGDGATVKISPIDLLPQEDPTAPLSDAEVIAKAGSARNGAKFLKLMGGDVGEYGDDDSRADLALCSMLAFYTGPDHGRIDRLFRQSALYREKWNRQDYRDRTINKALEGKTEFYQVPDKKHRGLGKKWTAVDDEELKAPLTLELVSKHLGFPVEKLEHHSGTVSYLKITGPGGKIVSFTMSDLMSKRLVDAKIRGAFRVDPPDYNGTDWKRISLKILQCSDEIDTGEEATVEGSVRVALQAYLENNPPEDAEKEEALGAYKGGWFDYPVLKDGKIHIKKLDFVKYLDKSAWVKIDQINLPSVLISIGLKQDRVRLAGKQPRTWSMPAGWGSV